MSRLVGAGAGACGRRERLSSGAALPSARSSFLPQPRPRSLSRPPARSGNFKPCVRQPRTRNTRQISLRGGASRLLFRVCVDREETRRGRAVVVGWWGGETIRAEDGAFKSRTFQF